MVMSRLLRLVNLKKLCIVGLDRDHHIIEDLTREHQDIHINIRGLDPLGVDVADAVLFLLQGLALIVVTEGIRARADRGETGGAGRGGGIPLLLPILLPLVCKNLLVGKVKDFRSKPV